MAVVPCCLPCLPVAANVTTGTVVHEWLDSIALRVRSSSDPYIYLMDATGGT